MCACVNNIYFVLILLQIGQEASGTNTGTASGSNPTRPFNDDNEEEEGGLC